MPFINLLPLKTPIIKPHWISYTLFLLLFSSVCLYFFKQSQQKPTLVPVSEKTTKISENGLFNNYFLHQLQMVGFLKAQHSKTMALGLLKSPDQKISTVKVGDCIGKEKAWITAIEEKQIILQLPDQTTSRFIRLSH